MRVYMVRHGETVPNVSGVHQNASTPLSSVGIAQVELVAKRFSELPIDLILSSPHLRAKHTAQQIADQSQKEIEYVDILREIKWPSEIEGLKHTDPESIRVRNLLREKNQDQNWHYSDEDNFFDVKKRAMEFIAKLEQRIEENIAIVSHGNFIKMIVLVMFLGDGVTPDLFERAKPFFRTKNTGLSICEKKERGDWSLITWNDHAHLGEVVDSWESH